MASTPPTPRRPLREILSTDAGLTVLLSSLVVVLFGIYPFAPLHGPGRLVLSLALTLVLVSGVFTLAHRPRLLILALVLAGVALVTRWLGHFTADEDVRIWFHASTILFLLLTTRGVLAQVVRKGRITSQRIQGAVAVYLMSGLIWGFAYSLLELREPGSFRLSPAPPAGGWNMHDFVYFSFVTLTTLGYGDMAPLSPTARTLAILEALAGQLYLVILIARLISLQVADSEAG